MKRSRPTIDRVTCHPASVVTTAAAYDVPGRACQHTDAKGVVARTGYDNANQPTQQIEDLGGLNRTTNFTWTLDAQKSTMTAVNAVTGDQTTTWTFGTTLADSGVARNDLVRYIDYPDSVAGSDREAFTYNRLGERKTFADQRGTVRTFYRDLLGRETNDCVTTLGSATDGAVMQIARTYEIRGRVATVTSFDSATPNSGTILNQCALTYNDFMQLTLEQQEHSGAVTGSTPSVGYAYASGAGGSNQIRFTNLIYPNGRNIQSSFGTAGGMNDLLNRIDTIQDVTSGTVDLASYIYLGLATPVRIIYPEPQVWLDLWGGVSGQFAGLDQFDRVIDQRWQSNINTTPTDIDRYQLGRDANSNPTYKANIVGTPNVAGGLDELYGTDTLNRLIQMQRGVLNAARTAITGTPARQMNWSLDPTGNWPAYVTQTTGTTDLNQGRASNPVNEITGITSSGGTPVWVTPAYDAAGNMTTMPQPGTPTSAFTAVYDAWKRMVSISAGGSPVGLYQYDGRHRRIIADTTEARHFYFTDNWQDIEQRVGSATTMDQQHVWGIRYIDELVCRDDATPQRLYVCQDAIFSVTCLTDTSGTPQEYFVYDPYGFAAVMTGAWAATSDAFTWVTRFQGLCVDLGTELTLARARWLNFAVGQWTQRDRDGYIDGASLYQYEEGAPASSSDPTGTSDSATRPNYGSLSGEDMRTKSAPNVFNEHITFKPTSSCDCSEILFVQISRTVEDGNLYFYGDPARKERAVHDGWTLDQSPATNPYPWYEMDEKGKLPPAFGQKGSTTQKPTAPAILKDSGGIPQRVEGHIDLESCAVCAEGSQKGTVYGCVTWSFTWHKDHAKPPAFVAPGAPASPSKIFIDATNAWNSQAQNGKNKIPNQQALPPLKY